MRRLMILFASLLLVTACTVTDETEDADPTAPSASPTEAVTETPEPTATAEASPTGEATPTPAAEPSPAGTPGDTDEEPADPEEQVDEIAEQVVELRGLELEEELDFAIMSRDELEELLRDEVDVQEEDIDLYWIFRLIDDRDLNLEDLLIEAQAVDIYGLYDPDTQETYVIAEDGEIGVLEEVFVAHEITHALQDQHFGLEPLESLEPDYDRLMAFRAMIEGDATLVQQLYLREYLSQEELQEFQQEALAITQNQGAVETIEALPRYFVESLSVPYTAGLEFMMQAYDGDFDDVNEALEDPPASSQQMLNPAEYLAGEIEDPVEVDLPDLGEQLEGDWEEHRSGTFGVFDLRIMLEENGVDETEEIFDPWRGSSFAAYIQEDEVLGVLASRWENDEAATAFEDALVETMADYEEQDGIWAGEDRFHAIVRDGDAVTLYSSTDQDALQDAME